MKREKPFGPEKPEESVSQPPESTEEEKKEESPPEEKEKPEEPASVPRVKGVIRGGKWSGGLMKSDS